MICLPGRLALDFGTSNTVLAAWDETRKDAVPLALAEFSRYHQFGEEFIPVIPSLIHYGESGQQWIGDQVLRRNLHDSPRTFRWMKRYIAYRSPLKVRVDGREISPFDAGRDFLLAVLALAREELDIGDEEIAITLPVETFEHFEDWLIGVAEDAGLPRLRFIDEPSAAALGYGAQIQPGDVYLVFDFGAGTLDVAVVRIEECDDALVEGRRCRILGKAGADLGGVTVDQWLFQEVLRRNGRSDADDVIRRLSRTLLVECERAKERLSFHDAAEISVIDPDTGAVIGAEFSRDEFEDLLDRHNFFYAIDQTVRRAISISSERGYSEEHIKAVMLVGGSSLIPSVQKTISRMFGRERIMLNRPIDAVVRGAAAFVGGIDFYDHIQHHYAIRYFNPKTGGYEYKVVVRRGTPYPSKEPLARLTVKASHDGQTQLGIAVFEVSEHRKLAGDGAPEVELVFGPAGDARLVQVTPEEEERRSYFWMNMKNPTFLIADPPAKKGEPRFEVEFSVDDKKRLLLTARDIRNGKVILRDFPVVKMM